MTLKYLTAWDNRVQGTPKIAYKFGDMVKAATNGRITMKFSGPEVIKSRQQFQPVSRGVFDMNLSVAPYYVGTTGVPMAALTAEPTAASGGMMGASPTPRTPKGCRLLGTSTMMVSIIGRSEVTGMR